jgi:hypothetical protein
MDRHRLSDDLLFAFRQRPPDVGAEEDALGDEFEPEHYEVVETRRGVTAALCRHLGYGWRYEYSVKPELVDFVMPLVDGLEEVLRTKAPKDPSDWATREVLSAAKGMNKWTLWTLLEELQLTDREVDAGTTYEGLAKAMKRALVLEVSGALSRMMLRWKADGIFDQTHRRRRMQPSASRSETIDRATAPRYVPPGRT